MVVASPDDLVNAVMHDRRMDAYRVRRQGEGWIELEVVAQRARVPSLLVLAWPGVWRDDAQLRPHLVRARSGNYGLILIGSEAELEAAKLDAFSADTDLVVTVGPISVTRLLLLLRSRAEAIAQRMAAGALELELERSRHENDMLTAIGRALSQERKIESLLALILRRACEVTNADAGSIYRVVGDDEELAKRRLRFEVSQNDSRQVPAAGFEMPVSASSIVGRCVLEGDRIKVKDLYALDEPGMGNNGWGFVHDRTFDDKYGYQTRSVLAVPMISARAEVIGVIQLINKRARGWIQLDLPTDFENGVVEFDEVSVAHVSTLASQAGIALENVLLYDEVKALFDGFVKASVKAIESRDPTTSGHSERVADLTVELAKAVNMAAERGHYRQIKFSADQLVQIEYAALLHDFGKVGVREHVLVKAKKLYEHERELILQRFKLIKRGYQIDGLESKVRYLMESTREEAAERMMAIDRDLGARITELDDIIRFILQANEPTVLEQGSFERIAEIAGLTYGVDGGAEPYLRPEEVSALQIRRGSLTEKERLEINDHVVHSMNFLKEIPWSRTLNEVPTIAGAHHEKLDGTGYPGRARGDDIPVEARIMAITDIYDALTASDRPYKKAIPPEKALAILHEDVLRGQLDRDLFDIFRAARVWTVTQRERR